MWLPKNSIARRLWDSQPGLSDRPPQPKSSPCSELAPDPAPTIPLISSVLVSSSMISCRDMDATDSKASAGHSLNQSMVQQLTKEGNCRRRARKISPMGLVGRGPNETETLTATPGCQGLEPFHSKRARSPFSWSPWENGQVHCSLP